MDLAIVTERPGGVSILILHASRRSLKPAQRGWQRCGRSKAAPTEDSRERQVIRLGIDKGGRLPNVIIIGAMKAGTSSLHFYLDQHPDIHMSRTKELRFFVEEVNWPRGLDWYRSQFSSEVPFAGESTPGYTAYPFRRGVPERMHDTIPDAKLIYVVRDPIDRAVSHYVHQVTAGREQRPLAEAMKSPDENYVARSSYYLQVTQYLEFFDKEQMLIVNTADLSQRRAETLREVFRFIGADESFDSPNFTRIRGKSRDWRKPTPTGVKIGAFIDRSLSWIPPGRKRNFIRRPILFPFSRPMERPVLEGVARERLRDLLAEDVHAFREWTDNPLTGWSM